MSLASTARKIFVVSVAFCVLVTQSALAQKKNAKNEPKGPPAIKALMIAGGCCHDYPNQIEILTQGISQRANVEWETFLALSPRDRELVIYQTEDWTKGYEVIVHNECYGGVMDPSYVDRMVKGHTKHKVPVVAIHCAMHSYRNAATDQWRKLLGVTSKRHEKKYPLEVVNRASDHPIMQGFGGSWQTPNGELYVIEKSWPNCRPLATVYGQQTKTDQPVIWTNEFEGTRTFGTTLGHHNETMLCDEYLDVVTRGLLWACKKITPEGKPMPGYEGSGEAPILLKSQLIEAAGANDKPKEASWAKSVWFPKGETPVDLFNGKDLEGWVGNQKYWSVDNGMIIAKNEKDDAPKASTYLLTPKNYKNFRLVFEGKLVRSKMHSGISLWGKPVEKENDPHSYQGHLVMFPSNWGFYDLYRRKSIYKDDGRAKAAAQKGDWDRIEILAIAPRIQLAVNGKLVADWTDPKPELCEPGPIGLQLHSNKVPQEVHFRGLRLSENPKPELITISK